MRYRRQLFGVTTWVAAGAVALGSAMAAPPPIPSAYPAAAPPGRVGRVARLAGAVSFHTADADHWDPAAINYPVTSGDAFWTEPQAHADIGIAGSRIAMDGSTEFDVTTLDDQTLAAVEPQGGVYLHLANVPGGVTSVQTPRGTVQLAGDGRYEIVAGATGQPTTVTVLEGTAEIAGAGLSLQVGPQQTATITGTDSFQGSVGPLVQDAFLAETLAQERPVVQRPATLAPPVVQGMTGANELDQYGTWQPTPDYGSVWVPPVASAYIPYRDGSWSYVTPWGWTWVDAAPWGFAPFHYGRWVHVEDRWCWAPGMPEQFGGAYPQPVYAPALVSFVDLGGALAVGAVGVGVGFAAGGFAGGGFPGGGYGSRNVGWVPLGPGEPYFPPYNHNADYIRRVNVTNIRNVNQVITNLTINNRTVVQNPVNRSAATVVPVAAMVQSRPIAAAAQPLSLQQLGQLQPQPGVPVRPTLSTPGITPGVAQALRLAPMVPGQPGARSTPGPGFARAAPPLLALPAAAKAGGIPASPARPSLLNPLEPARPSSLNLSLGRPVPPPINVPTGAVRPSLAPPIQRPASAAATPREARPLPQVVARPLRAAVPPPPRPPVAAYRPANLAQPRAALPRPAVAPQPRFAPPPRSAAPPAPAASARVTTVR